MVAGGLCKNGVSKLMFCIGTIQSWAYKRAVDYYKEDSDRLRGVTILCMIELLATNLKSIKSNNYSGKIK